jgi:tRNA-splicing ligase RtcB
MGGEPLHDFVSEAPTDWMPGQLVCFGDVEHDVKAQMKSAMEKSNAYYGVLCADNHIGYSVPVGGVLALEGSISPNAVGYDIACGNKAVVLDVDPNMVRDQIDKIMDQIQTTISFGIGSKNAEKVESPIFDEPIWSEIPFLADLKDKAVEQLGTVGGGNHYIDVFSDESDRIWVGVHFGSRGLGHSMAKHFVKLGGGVDGVYADPVVFAESSELGQQYIKCMELAGRYAYAGRDWVCQRVAAILGGAIVREVHNHHNFAWLEHHFGRDLWVIRKGSTPAFHGQEGFVGGSMGDNSVILRGTESEISERALQSTVHGAGRCMGRTQAKGKPARKGKPKVPGLIKQEDMQLWLKARGIVLRGGEVDEAPQAYKRLNAVLEAHTGTIEILHQLRPLGVCMADNRTLDPYKD